MEENIHIHSPKVSFSWHVLALLIPAIIFASILAFFINRGNTPQVASSVTESKAVILINNQTITADIADSEEEREQGLSGRANLIEGEGLLFDFTKQNGVPGFWMKDMLIPIDIIWIKDGKIIHIDKNAEPQPGIPDTSLSIYSPERNINDIDYVLEVPAGYSDKYSLAVDQNIEIK